jgi:hypothetical protein
MVYVREWSLQVAVDTTITIGTTVMLATIVLHLFHNSGMSSSAAIVLHQFSLPRKRWQMTVDYSFLQVS